MQNKNITNHTLTEPTAKEAIRNVLKDDECFRDVMQAINGDAGSRAFNQAAATMEFLEHDHMNGGVVNSMMKSGKINHRQVWLHLAAVLKAHEKQYQRLIGEVAK